MDLDSGIAFEGNLTGLVEDSVVEYSITAIDAFGKTVESLNGTEYYSFTIPPTTPTITGDGGLAAAIAVVVILLAVGVAMVYYMLVIKKK